MSLEAIKQAKRNVSSLWNTLPTFPRKTSKERISIFLPQNLLTSSECNEATKGRSYSTLIKT